MEQQHHQRVALIVLERLHVGHIKRTRLMDELAALHYRDMRDGWQLRRPALEPLEVLQILPHFRVGRFLGVLLELLPAADAWRRGRSQHRVKPGDDRWCERFDEALEKVVVDFAACLQCPSMERAKCGKFEALAYQFL